MFAQRTNWDRTQGRFAAAVASARAHGAALSDLTESNPTRADLFSSEPLIAELGHPRGTVYTPDALGHPTARAAVCTYYAERNIAVDPGHIVLTASTSEAYGYLFKLLCERGDNVLVPAPSYPLFDYLAASEDVVVRHYPLIKDHGFRIDIDALARAADERTRAILIVHPNNPTGSLARRDEAEALEQLAAERGLALIVDEVFGDYPLAQLAQDRVRSFAGRSTALTFVLSGLSKVLALPQIKLGWMAVSGPEGVVGEAIARLDVLADTYLSVSTPVQLALPDLLRARTDVQARILMRTHQNLAALDAAISQLGAGGVVRRLHADAGWYAVLEVPRIHGDDEWVEILLEHARVIVHPGYFFDFDRDGFLIVSLLPKPHDFRNAVTRMLGVITAESGAPLPNEYTSAPVADATLFAAINLTPEQTALLRTARDLAERAHRGQVRKGDTSVPYFVHVEATAAMLQGYGVTDVHVIAAAYLHDLLEDQPQFAPELESAMPPEVVSIVRTVTENKLDEGGKKRPKEDRFRECFERLLAGSLLARQAALVSFADQLHNARSLIESEARGHALLGNLATKPHQKLRHLAELRNVYTLVATPQMLDEFDKAVADLARCVAAFHART